MAQNNYNLTEQENESKSRKSGLMRKLMAGATLVATLTFGGLAGCSKLNPLSMPTETPNSPPKIEKMVVIPPSGYAPFKAIQTADVIDPDGDPITYNNEIIDKASGKVVDSVSSAGSNYYFDKPGDYEWVLTARDPSGKTDKKTIEVTVLQDPAAPSLDFSKAGKDIGENSSVEIDLPGDSDIEYTGASVASGDVTLDKSGLENKIIKLGLGDINKNGIYKLDLVYKSKSSGKTGAGVVEGGELNKLDYGGKIEDDETHTPQQSVLKVRYTDSSGTHRDNIRIIKGSPGPNNTIYTLPDGTFLLEINEPADNISGVDIEAGIGDYTTKIPTGSGFSEPYAGPSKSWTRVRTTTSNKQDGTPQTLPLGDDTDLTIRPTPFGAYGLPLNSSGKITNDLEYRNFFYDIWGNFTATGRDPQDTQIGTFNTQKVEVAQTNPTGSNPYGDGSAFADTSTMKQIVNDLSDMATNNGKISDVSRFTYQLDPTPSQYEKPGWATVIPADTYNRFGKGILGNTIGHTCYIRHDLTSSALTDVAIHEIAHTLIAPCDTAKYKNTIFYQSNSLEKPSGADKKAGRDSREKNYLKGEWIGKTILKKGFNVN